MWHSPPVPGPPLAVIAVGGNSLITSRERTTVRDQSEEAARTSQRIAELLARGWNLVLTHGNGPQVGFILRRCEIGRHEVPPIPMNYATSNTQGSIGYMFQRNLGNELRRRGIDRKVVTLITQTRVDADDPAFSNPLKPIGPWLDEATARQRATERGWSIREDAGRGWRRVVPSPVPREILELEVIGDLARAGVVVIAAGGGGLPVTRDSEGDLHGLEAVIDKDRASSLLARCLGADRFAISTAVDRVAIDFGLPSQRWLDRMSVSEARAWTLEGQFAPGSMKPKVEAVVDWVEATGRTGVITDPSHLPEALDGDAGTQVVPDGPNA